MRLEKIRTDVTVLDTGESIARVFDCFKEKPHLCGLLIYHEGRFLTCIFRREFHEIMSRPFSLEIFMKRTIGYFVNAYPMGDMLELSSDTNIALAAERAIKRSPDKRDDPIVVRYPDGEVRLLDVHQLLLQQIQLHLDAIAALKEANEFRSDIVSIASHDIKNPLFTILGLSQMLGAGDSGPDSIVSLSRIINNSAQRIQELLNEVLGLATSGTIEMQLKKELYPAGRILEEVAKRFIHLAERKQQNLVIEVDSDNTLINVDIIHFQEALENLISNAIKYSDKGSEIICRVYAGQEGVVFEIIDHGPGFSEEDRKYIFQKFKKLSAKPTGGESSTGLGLFITRKIVDLHGGAIVLESEIGKGSKFTVRLPLMPHSMGLPEVVKLEKAGTL
ncbi:MAG: ATP-binding protein [Ignavibacteria bacterium]|nr:ATP-binding protein [Ignavibacteria bacterium]